MTPTVRAQLSAGYGRERPEQERARNRSRWVGADVSVILPYGFTVGGGGEVRWMEFEGEWPPYTPAGEDRADRTRSLRLSVHNRAFTLMGFSPEIVVVNEERETNAQPLRLQAHARRASLRAAVLTGREKRGSGVPGLAMRCAGGRPRLPGIRERPQKCRRPAGPTRKSPRRPWTTAKEDRS